VVTKEKEGSQVGKKKREIGKKEREGKQGTNVGRLFLCLFRWKYACSSVPPWSDFSFKWLNHGMPWVGRDLKDHQFPNPLPQAGLPTTRSSTRLVCPGPHPTQPWTPPRMGHPQPLWAACSRTSPLSVKNFSLTFNLHPSSFSLKPFPLVLSLSTCAKCWFLSL